MKKSIITVLFSTLALAGCNFVSGTNPTVPSTTSNTTVITSQDSDTTNSTSADPTSGPTTAPTSNPTATSNPTSSGKTSTGTSTGTSTTSAPTPVVNSVSLNKTSASVEQGKTLQLSATVTGTNNPSKEVTWKSSNSNVATVSSTGLVSVKDTATVGTTVKITATSVVNTNKSASCTITVLAAPASTDTYTILIYMCGADLESNNSLASSDLLEILNTNKPDNVNIVIETGGARKWSSNPGTNASYLQRRHVENKKLVVDSNESKANMGLSSTLQSFLTWGLSTYKADHTGLIMWNHGGAASGCCFDENYSSDGIRPSEFNTAVKNALSANNMSGQKLDWIGYDCCIMSYADLASINSQYFNYMVSSQELESGYGWDYDAWLPTLYANTAISTPTLLAKIADTFVSENGGTSTSNDQCLSVLDLSKMANFTSKFNTFASSLKSSDWSTIKSYYSSSLRFANISDYGTAYGYGLCDAKNFFEKASAKYSVSEVSSALAEVTVYSKYGGYYKNTKPCGLNLFVPADSSSYAQISKDEYGASDTLLTSWRSFVVANGTFYSSWY